MYEEIESIYINYYGQLYKYIIKIGGNSEFVDDIIQNTFVQAIKNIESFKKKSSLKTWLFSIARYELYTYFRKNKMKMSIEDIVAKGSSCEVDCTDKIVSIEILEYVKKLNPPVNEIMKLRLVYGMAFKEIGRMVGKSENYCRVSFYRVKEKIKKEYV